MKATVDAYDGSVTLYAWDDEDPVLQTWQKVFPATVKPIERDDAATCSSHVRYPADLFKVQRAILGTYHVTDAGTFFSSERRVGDSERPDAADQRTCCSRRTT